MRAVLLLALTAGVAWGAGPPAALTAGQAKLLRERAALRRKAQAAWKDGKQGEALESVAGARELAVRVHGPLSWLAYVDASWLASWEEGRGRWKEGAGHREAMLRAMSALHGEGHWRAIDARLELAEALEQPKRTEAQRAALRRATTLGQQTVALHGEGKAASALPLARKALALRKEVLGSRHPHYATGLNNLALLLKDMGDHRGALPLLKEALALRKEVLGARHPHYARSLNNLAMLLQDMGDHRGALPLFKEALALSKEVLGARSPEYAGSLNNLALLLHDMGDHKGALPLSKEALALRKEVLGVRHPHYANSLSNLASLLSAMGDHRGALPLFKEALTLTKEALGERHPHHARSLNNLAVLLQAMGDHRGALPLFKEALTLRKEALGARHPSYATSLNNLATLLNAMGDHGGALPLFKEALALHKETLGARHPSYATSLNNLALLLHARGDHRGALPLMEGSLALTASHLRDNASIQSDRQQLANLALLRHRLDNRLLIEDGEGHPSAAAHVLSWKGQVLLRQQQRRLFLRLGSDPKAGDAARRLQDVTHRLVALRSSPAATAARLDDLQKEQDGAQAELSRLSADFRGAKEREAVTPEALARALPEGAVLVDLLFSEHRLHAFVHRRGRGAVRVPLGRAAPVRSAAREWREELTRGRAGTAQGETLHRLIWAPLERHLEGAKVILVSPDGALGTVPFAALPGKKARSYLIEDVAVAVVAVPSIIPDLMRPGGDKGRLPPSLLAVGGVDYEGAPVAVASSRGAPLGLPRGWSALPGTAPEAAAVAKSFAARFKAETLSLSGREATSGAVRAALPRTRYAHLATHGYFAPESVRSATEPDGKRPEDRPPSGWDPQLLSGLAFAGANREPKPGEEDGILTALEVSEMDLSKLELAVLSACETGLGQVAGGEGLLGMQRAFAAANARTVVASLWQVDDRATQTLMGDFYSLAWGKDAIAKAEALRKAQLAMLFGRTLAGRPRGTVGELVPEKGTTRRVPPYYWAAFVLSGDWR